MFKKTVLLLSSAIFLAACEPDSMSDVPGRLETTIPNALPPMSMFGTPNPQAPTRSNAAIARDFLDLSFQMESGRLIPVLSRFEGPVTAAALAAAIRR